MKRYFTFHNAESMTQLHTSRLIDFIMHIYILYSQHNEDLSNAHVTTTQSGTLKVDSTNTLSQVRHFITPCELHNKMKKVFGSCQNMNYEKLRRASRREPILPLTPGSRFFLATYV